MYYKFFSDKNENNKKSEEIKEKNQISILYYYKWQLNKFKTEKI